MLTKEYQREYRDKNKKRIKEYCKNYYKKNSEAIKEYGKTYRKNKDKYLKENYGLSLNTIRRYGLELALKVYDRAERKCEKCGEINGLVIHHKDGKGRNYENEGLKPNNSLNNLTVLCRRCHSSLHDKGMRKDKKTGKFIQKDN